MFFTGYQCVLTVITQVHWGDRCALNGVPFEELVWRPVQFTGWVGWVSVETSADRTSGTSVPSSVLERDVWVEEQIPVL